MLELYYWIVLVARPGSSVTLYSTDNNGDYNNDGVIDDSDQFVYMKSRDGGQTWEDLQGGGLGMELRVEWDFYSSVGFSWKGESGDTGVSNYLDWAYPNLNTNDGGNYYQWLPQVGENVGPGAGFSQGKLQIYYMGNPT